ncbi:MAG: hypothetical protein WCE30_10515 [Mycobacterium sp.]
MSQNGPFGINPEDFDRAFRDAGDGIRDALERLARGSNWASLLGDLARQPRTEHEPATAGAAGDGIWVIHTVGADGGAHIEEAYPSELDALRANKNNTDPTRRVRFLPYGIAVSVLDAPE